MLHSLFYWQIWKKTFPFPGFENHYKKSVKQECSCLFGNSILQNGKMRVENQTKTRVWEDMSWCPETSTKNAVQEFHLRTVKIEFIFEKYRIQGNLCTVWWASSSHVTKQSCRSSCIATYFPLMTVSVSLCIREDLRIYRRPSFLTVLWFGSMPSTSPPPFSATEFFLFFSLPVSRR